VDRYTLQPAYIISTGAFLPGKAIDNEEMENVLGLVNGRKSKYKRRILQSNGITSRHYAIKANGEPSHLTDELAAESIKKALQNLGEEQSTLDMIAVGTTLPDLLAPGIASMVHGRIGGKNTDILSCSGICGAGAAAFKSASLSVICGQHNRVVACGTERPSVIMRGDRFKQESDIKKSTESDNISESYRYFNADFLRWMLSDGAGAFIIDSTPNKHGLSLKIDWIETASYANEFNTCMYMGTSNPEKPSSSNTWLHQNEMSGAEKGLLLLRQDIKMLHQNMPLMFNDMIQKLIDKKLLIDDEVDWFLPHLSSYFFYDKLLEILKARDINIPEQKWYTNLKTKGNTGAASIYIMLDELLSSNKLKDKQKILMMVPESGRFSITFAQLTVHNNSIN